MTWATDDPRAPHLEISATAAALEMLGAPSWATRHDDHSRPSKRDARRVLLVVLSSEADTAAAQEASARGRVALGIASGEALAAGIRVDDVLFLPTSFEEVRDRALRAYARRARVDHLAPEPPRVRLEDGALRSEGCDVALSASEQGLVQELLAAGGSLVTRARLELVLGTPDSSRALDAHIYRLRAKLRAFPGLELLTVRQRGFRLVIRAVGAPSSNEEPCACGYPPPLDGTR